jgi:hypothetical protein
MANRAYVSAWAKDFSETAKLERFGRLLETAPLSETAGAPFNSLIVRALDVSETPLREWDLRGQKLSPHAVMQLAGEHQGTDVAYEVNANWDLWLYDLTENRWSRAPQNLEIISYGEEFDGGIAAEEGHFVINAGFEHLFTGHSGILGTNAPRATGATGGSSGAMLAAGSAPARERDPQEAAFLEAMRDPQRLREYHEKTRENIRALLHWLREAETRVPLERIRLWSEGEEDLEARLDEILAAG